MIKDKTNKKFISGLAPYQILKDTLLTICHARKKNSLITCDSAQKFGTGFTLLEFMISILIFSIIMGAIFTVMTMGKKSWHSGNVQVEVQQEARRGLDKMVKELRQTQVTQIIGVPADGNPYSTISFRIPEDIDNDGDILDATSKIEWGNQITYSLGGLNGEQLIRTQGNQRVLANKVINLSFLRQLANPNILEISLQTQKSTVSGYTIGITLNSQVNLRN